MRYLKVLVPVVALSLLVASCAAKLPQAEVDAATAAFNDAKTAQADVFAADSYKLASDANDALQANLVAKDYGKTKKLSKALLDASTKANTDAVAGLEAAKADIATLSADINTLIPVVKAEVAAAAKLGKKAKVDVKPINAALAAAVKTVDAVPAATDVAATKAALTAAKESLTGFQTALEAAGYKN
jgi:hypothetical protein